VPTVYQASREGALPPGGGALVGAHEVPG
jgi:hypothetical protein